MKEIIYVPEEVMKNIQEDYPKVTSNIVEELIRNFGVRCITEKLRSQNDQPVSVQKTVYYIEVPDEIRNVYTSLPRKLELEPDKDGVIYKRIYMAEKADNGMVLTVEQNHTYERVNLFRDATKQLEEDLERVEHKETQLMIIDSLKRKHRHVNTLMEKAYRDVLGYPDAVFEYIFWISRDEYVNRSRKAVTIKKVDGETNEW